MLVFALQMRILQVFPNEGRWLLAMGKKLLSCVFLPEVLCSFRKSEHFAIMERCLKCSQYRRFEKEMENEEEEFFEEVKKIQKYGYPKRFNVPKDGS